MNILNLYHLEVNAGSVEKAEAKLKIRLWNDKVENQLKLMVMVLLTLHLMQ